MASPVASPVRTSHAIASRVSPTASAASESVTPNSSVGGLRSEPKLAVTCIGFGLRFSFGFGFGFGLGLG